ncbi:FluC/FEX family fluoride channel [Nocardioides sp. URHA0020]|uniref:FluC/FEX family fluoride channel n=1 Tax=Nocardioides sp. URHA0020 TaxID=1380392 RepID=UPI0006870CEC|nr:CrcB family protein [Nocardioides sp. URHA0020]
MTVGASTPRLLAAVAVGGAVGAWARWGLTAALPAEPDGFPWTTFAINVVGSFALALLPALVVVRRQRLLAVALGPGVLGGFTTLSAYSEQTRALLDHGHASTAGLYLVATLACCVVGVAVADHWSRPSERAAVAPEGGNE